MDLKEKETSCLQTLQQEWLWHCQAIGATDKAAIKWKDKLFKKYQRQGRFYHNLTHIAQMLNAAKEQQAEFSAWPHVFFAIWFHDAIQGYGLNSELESAKLASKALKELGANHAMIDHVYHMILSSKNHDSPKDYDNALFLDCDLSILGTPAQEYLRYAHQCRQEYVIPDCIYRKGRRKFLQSMLAKPFIYHTTVFRVALETQARANIANEINRLGA